MRISKTIFTVLLASIFPPIACVQQKTDIHYEGTFLDENGSPELVMTEREDGTYNVAIGIFRLTQLDDGIGSVTPKGLSFTATDAAGGPIGGVITLDGNTATVTFTDSTWPLLENGTSFQYTRQSEEDAVLYRVRSIYEDVACHPDLKELYCSADWKKTVAAVTAMDEKEHPGEIGFFDADYWVQGQDCWDLSISDLALESLSGKTASVIFTLHNLGYETPMRLLLVKEDGDWMVDDFISLNEPTLDWKAAMLEYLNND